MTASTCLVCGTGRFRPHLEILLKCEQCGFVTARMDGSVDYRALYEGAYFKGQEYLDYPADEAFFKKNFRRRLADVLGYTSGGRLLEIGAAYGFFLDLARAHFEVVGYEVNPDAVRYARERFGLDVREEDFLARTGRSGDHRPEDGPARQEGSARQDGSACREGSARQTDSGVSVGADECESIEHLGKPVDVTVMWDVIEHLERPDLFVRRIAELSRPGGMLHITTGDVGSLLARLRGRKWRMIHPPTHLHYFDRRTLPLLLSRFGFRTLDVKSVGVARSLRQILYSILVLGLNKPGMHQKLERLLPESAGFTLNTGDIMLVSAIRE